MGADRITELDRRRLDHRRGRVDDRRKGHPLSRQEVGVQEVRRGVVDEVVARPGPVPGEEPRGPCRARRRPARQGRPSRDSAAPATTSWPGRSPRSTQTRVIAITSPDAPPSRNTGMISEISSARPTGRQQSVGQLEPEDSFGQQRKADRQAVEHQRRPDEGEESLHCVRSCRLARRQHRLELGATTDDKPHSGAPPAATATAGNPREPLEDVSTTRAGVAIPSRRTSPRRGTSPRAVDRSTGTTRSAGPIATLDISGKSGLRTLREPR